MRLEGNIWQCKIPALIQSDKSCGRVAGLGVRKRRSRVRVYLTYRKLFIGYFYSIYVKCVSILIKPECKHVLPQ